MVTQTRNLESGQRRILISFSVTVELGHIHFCSTLFSTLWTPGLESSLLKYPFRWVTKPTFPLFSPVRLSRQTQPQRRLRLFPSSPRKKSPVIALWKMVCGSLTKVESMTSQSLWPCILVGIKSCWRQVEPWNPFGLCMLCTIRNTCWKSSQNIR